VKPGGIRPEWQLDARLEPVIQLLIVLRKTFPNFGCGCPDDWIEIRIVVRFPPEYLDAERALLQLLGVTIERALHNVAQEVGITLTVLEERIRKNSG